MDNLFIGKELAELLTKAKEIKETNTGNILIGFTNGSSFPKSWLQSGEEVPNYLNISKDEVGKISYATERRIQHFSWSCEEDIYGNHTHRFKAKVGKTLKKIFFSSVLEERGVTPQDIEIFVDQLKALAGKTEDDSFDSMKITQDFQWYDECNTSESAQDGSGSLGESCMRYDTCYHDGYFQIYDDNCSMLINKDEDGLVDMRALLWETVCGKKIMDRIYTDESYKQERFKAWANKKGFLYKEKQSYSNKVDFVFNGEELKDKTFLVELSESLDEYSRFPYMDTFTYAFEDDDTWYLTNNPRGVYHTHGITSFRKFECTDGDYGHFNLKELFVFQFVDGKLDLIKDVSANDNYRTEFISHSAYHKGSKLCSLFESHYTQDELDLGFEIAFSLDNFKTTEGNYDRVTWSRDEFGKRKLCLESEMFSCQSSGDNYINTLKTVETVDGFKCVEINTYTDYKGNIIRSCDARIVSVRGKVKIMNRNDEELCETFDGVARPLSECEYINFGNRSNYYSSVVHKDLIKVLKAEDIKRENARCLWHTITLKELQAGNVDRRKKY